MTIRRSPCSSITAIRSPSRPPRSARHGQAHRARVAVRRAQVAARRRRGAGQARLDAFGHRPGVGRARRSASIAPTRRHERRRDLPAGGRAVRDGRRRECRCAAPRDHEARPQRAARDRAVLRPRGEQGCADRLLLGHGHRNVRRPRARRAARVHRGRELLQRRPWRPGRAQLLRLLRGRRAGRAGQRPLAHEAESGFTLDYEVGRGSRSGSAASGRSSGRSSGWSSTSRS